MARVGIGGSTIVRISRAAFCEIDVISVFAASAKDCVGIFLTLDLVVEFLDDGCGT